MSSKATENDPCWEGYEQIGMKEKDGKQVPNCVPKSDETSLNTNDKPDDINSLSTKSQGYMEEGLEPVLGNLPIEAIATMVWQNINPAVKDVIKNKISGESWDEAMKELEQARKDKQEMIEEWKESGMSFTDWIKEWRLKHGRESKATEIEEDEFNKKHFDIEEEEGFGVVYKCKHCGEWLSADMPVGQHAEHIMFDHNIQETKATEEGIASVSGPADSSAIIGTGVHVKPEDDEEVEQNDPVLLNEAYVEDQFGYIYRPVYTNESRKIINDDLDYNGKLYTVEGVGNCPMCRGAGKVTVERLGLKECPKCDGSGDIQAEQEMPPQMEVPQEVPQEMSEHKKSKHNLTESCGCKTKAEEAKISAFESFINDKITILKKRAKGNESVTMMYGLPTVRKNGRKIKGTLAYAGVSLNDRIYLPEELAKGHGKTLPLLLNHSALAGAENEMDRLDDEMRNSLQNETDYQVGEVTLTWDADKLTLYYEGVVDNEFFQKEIDDMDMAVSLGIYYDSDSPVVCDEECYTLIKGAEFREVSLVYHAGFPIATIEAVEARLKKKSAESITLGHYDEEEKSDEVEDELPLGGSIDAEPVDDSQVVESFHAPQEFSVRGVSGMTISNTNGVERYVFDPTQNYSTNTIHFSVLGEGAEIFGEQLQPKMTTPEELTKEIEKQKDLVIEDADKDVIAEL